MSAIAILTGLLVLAYFGSILVGGRMLQGFGLPSGTEFLLLGILLGPLVFGVISRSTLASFEPLTVIALAWYGLYVGLRYGVRSSGRIANRRLVLGTLFGLTTSAMTAAAAGAVAYSWLGLRGRELWILSLGAGAVTSETTRYAVQWVAERYKAEGPLSELIGDLAHADDIVPLATLGVAFALGDVPEGLHIPWSTWTSFGSTLLVGTVLGATASALSDIESRVNERWGILLGTSLLGMGAAMRLGQSAPTTMFVMGVTISILSKRSAELRSMVAETERPVVLPALVLAGAHAAYPTELAPAAVVLAALGARVLAKFSLGLALRRSFSASAARDRLGTSLGLGLLPSGILTIATGLSFWLRFPDAGGRIVLALATVSCLVGEAVGPAVLRRELSRAGELANGATSTPFAAGAAHMLRPRADTSIRPKREPRIARGTAGPTSRRNPNSPGEKAP